LYYAVVTAIGVEAMVDNIQNAVSFIETDGFYLSFFANVKDFGEITINFVTVLFEISITIL